MQRSMSIDSLIINNPSWFTSWFGLDEHPTLPPGWLIERGLLENSETHVTQEAFMNSFFVVQGDLGWVVYCNRGCIRINVEAERRTSIHKGNLLIFRCVKS